ncbi:YbaK/EbsC family protein [Kitasatospora griseola]|uniref:YbaK/EbsC family protein n=1 Tax=Kitasatospora griseola TaxID=2064 RepID=UPI001F3F1A1B|nr:YbaK/EbsC family protein [Kitasatospora griseola]
MAEQKLADAAGVGAVRPAPPEEVRDALPGSLGAVGLASVTILADETLRGRRDTFTGANEEGVHLRGVDVERDIAVSRWTGLRRSAPRPAPGPNGPIAVRASTSAARTEQRLDESVLSPELLARGGRSASPTAEPRRPSVTAGTGRERRCRPAPDGGSRPRGSPGLRSTAASYWARRPMPGRSVSSTLEIRAPNEVGGSRAEAGYRDGAAVRARGGVPAGQAARGA